MINIEDFDKVEMRAGTVIEVKDNKKSRNKAYVVTIDFGEQIGIKNHLPKLPHYTKPENLIGKTNYMLCKFTTNTYWLCKSEVRILGTASEQGVVLLQPSEAVKMVIKYFDKFLDAYTLWLSIYKSVQKSRFKNNFLFSKENKIKV